MGKPILIFDGDCTFCQLWVERWRARTGDRVDYAPYQAVAAQYPQIPRERFAESVVFVASDGAASFGAEAALRALATVPSGHKWWWVYRRIPGCKAISEWSYRRIACNRPVLSWLTRRCWGDSFAPPNHALVQWLFLRGLAVIYLIAFLSLGVQIVGLVGEQGILPAAKFLNAAQSQLGADALWRVPTLAWLSASDHFLQFLCFGGAGLAVLLLIGVAPPLTLVGLWIFYLSLTTVCRLFLGFQWDNLLLEVGFMAIFFAPWRLWAARAQAPGPPRAALWLMRLLLFKLMVSSGVVKLMSGDVTWRNLTAMNFHYETQPLPTWIGWYWHQLPEWFHKLEVLGTFGMELIVPFFLFFPRRIRFVACLLIVVLQLNTMLTGNYGFFNLLTIVMCIALLDDAWLQRFVPGFKQPVRPELVEGQWYRARVVGMLAIIMILLELAVSHLQFIRKYGEPGPLRRVSSQVASKISPLRTINRYGLFAVMTTTQPEIVFEGSADGKTWREYQLPWKQGDPMQRPRFVQPYMPRLDWQLWFAALSRFERHQWVGLVMQHLQAGTPEVLELFKENPFPDTPPQQVRALLYHYHFTDRPTKRATGAWWRRELRGRYGPIISRSP